MAGDWRKAVGFVLVCLVEIWLQGKVTNSGHVFTFSSSYKEIL
jgi:hypothetical protein